MSTAFLIYVIIQLDSINNTLGFCAALTFFATAGIIAFNIMYYTDKGCESDESKEALKYIASVRKKAIVGLVMLTVTATLTPSTKTAIYMLGGSATIEALQSPEAKEVGGKVMELLQKKLDEELGNESR